MVVVVDKKGVVVVVVVKVVFIVSRTAPNLLVPLSFALGLVVLPA